MVRFLSHCAWPEINHTAALYTEQEESARERERGEGEREREREREIGALQVREMVRHVEGERERDSII